MSRYFVLLAVFLFAGCTIVPDSIDVPEGTQLVSYSKAVTSGASAQGQKARWGGLIVGVENKPNQTLIELAHFPLNHYGKPGTNGETSGRFVDPIVFEEGRSATFLGTITAPTAGMVGEQPYIYPTIIADDYHMWRKQQVYDVNTYFFTYHPGWYSPFYRFNGPWMSPHFNRTRVIRYENGPSKAKLPTRNSGASKSSTKSTSQPLRKDKQK